MSAPAPQEKQVFTVNFDGPSNISTINLPFSSPGSVCIKGPNNNQITLSDVEVVSSVSTDNWTQLTIVKGQNGGTCTVVEVHGGFSVDRADLHKYGMDSHLQEADRRESEADAVEYAREQEEARREYEEDLREYAREQEDARREYEEDLRDYAREQEDALREQEDAQREYEEDLLDYAREQEDARREYEEDLRDYEQDLREYEMERSAYSMGYGRLSY